MLKMFKVLKKIIYQNLSSLLGASTVSQTAKAAIYVMQIIRIGVIEEYAIPPPHQRNGSGASRSLANNPIEVVFAKMKNPLRNFAARSNEALVEAIGVALLSAVSAADVRGFFEHAGYRPTGKLARNALYERCQPIP